MATDCAFITILGASDAEKTTFLSIMAGIDALDKGKIFYDGKDLNHVAVQKLPVAMVYQQFVNCPSMTIYENIASPLRVANKKYSKTEMPYGPVTAKH